MTRTRIPEGVKVSDIVTVEEFRRMTGQLTPAELKVEASKPTKYDVNLEKELQRDCENYLRQHGIEFLHLSPKAREKEGWPDLVFVVDRIPHAVELKSATGKVSQEQLAVMERMASNGWRVHVIRTFEAFIEIVDCRTP